MRQGMSLLLPLLMDKGWEEKANINEQLSQELPPVIVEVELQNNVPSYQVDFDSIQYTLNPVCHLFEKQVSGDQRSQKGPDAWLSRGRNSSIKMIFFMQ